MDDLKETLTRYLDELHDALLWKLDGLGEYDLRRPLTPTPLRREPRLPQKKVLRP